jgi:hypothetical protein
MRINILFIILTAALLFAGCDEKGPGSSAPKEALISQGFVDDNTYTVVCRGYPLEGSTGIQKSESSKRAALLGAYYYIQTVFNDSVAPDKDGKAEKYEYKSDHVVVHYVVHKKGLKKMVKTGQ